MGKMVIHEDSTFWKMYCWVCNYSLNGVIDRTAIGKTTIHKPSNLCSLFWSFILRCLWLIVGWMLAGFIVGFVLVGFASPLIWLLWNKADVFVSSGLVVYGACALIAGHHFGVKAIHRWKQKRGDSNRPKQSSVIWAWVKAKRHKVCPMIEYVDSATTTSESEEGGYA